MKRLDWNEAKNVWLQIQRGVSFEDVQAAIDAGKLLADMPHPLADKYPHQRVFIFERDGYVFACPYVEDAEKIFLKTIYPSRKLTQEYNGGGN